MSRRAKIIFACLMLALLGVPLVYALLTWHPAEPLRFHAKTLREQHYRNPSNVDFQVYEIEVENTTGVPIHIIHGAVSFITPSASTFPIASEPAGFLGKDEHARPAGRTLSHAILEEVITVPAYGKVRCIAGIYADATAVMNAGQVHIAYQWRSGTKEVALGITSWLQKNVFAEPTVTPPSFPSADYATAPVHAGDLHLPPSRNRTPVP